MPDYETEFMKHCSSTSVLGGDQALAIAQADALKAYRDLSGYRIIDAATGAIAAKRYEQ